MVTTNHSTGPSYYEYIAKSFPDTCIRCSANNVKKICQIFKQAAMSNDSLKFSPFF